MDYSLLVIQTLNGLQLGILLFLVAAGLTLTFGIMDLVNLAHGSLYMLGAFFCAFVTLYAGAHFPIWMTSAIHPFFWGIIIALPLTALAGLAVEYVVIQHLYSRDHLDHVLATFGLILCIDSIAQMVFPAEGYSIPLPDFLKGQVTIATGIVFPTYRILIISVGLLVAAALYVLVTHTRLGMLIRAGASNRTMIGALGINIAALFTGVFILGATIAGLAGMMIAPITEASFSMGNDIIIVTFVIIIVGGIGSMKGAFVAAILIGLIDTMGRSYLDDIFKLAMSAENAETAAPAVSAMLVYILMAIVLAARPQGLFPPKTR